MSKRNLILLISVLVIIVVIAFGFFYFYQPANQNGGTSENTNFFANFLPFGKSSTSTSTDENPPTDISGYEPQTEINISDLELKKISSFPVAGFGISLKERYKEEPITTPSEQPEDIEPIIPKPTPPTTEFIPSLRYVNRETGNIYQTFADKIDERKFSSTIIPKIYEAFFGDDGESVIMRYLNSDNKTIETFVGDLPKEYLGADSIGTNEISGKFLPENISDMSVSPSDTKIFYLFNLEDSVTGITYTLKTGTKTQVFDSPFTEWLSFWPNNKMITLTTKPSAGIPGFMYKIDPDKKDFNKILSNINGLTTLTSPDGKLVLYGDDNLALYVYNIETQNSDLLGIKTIPEKCVWGNESDILYCAVPTFVNQVDYPDSWYRGEVSFSDNIWKINIASKSTILIADPSTLGLEAIDGIKLNLSENQDYLFFINKKDSYLWELKLK